MYGGEAGQRKQMVALVGQVPMLVIAPLAACLGQPRWYGYGFPNSKSPQA